MSTRRKTRDLGNGFRDHGVGCTLAGTRGIVATKDGAGRDVALAWLSDCRACFGLLMIDAETGKSETFPVPVPPGDSPFASVLSSGNKFYSHFNSVFLEFDPVKRAFTHVFKTMPRVGMGMTEDDEGRIWAVTYPDSGVLMFDPRSGEFRDYGSVHSENWRQYSRTVAADDAGWLYFALGNTFSQLLALHPDSNTAVPLLPESERVPGVSSYIYRDMDGRVYGLLNQNGSWDGPWYELHGGRAVKLDKKPPNNPKPIICGLQCLFHKDFPSGKKIKNLDMTERKLTIADPGAGTEKVVSFSYESEGSHLMAVAAAPDGTISGGAAWWVSYDPKADAWTHGQSPGQANSLDSQGGLFYIGTYTHGKLHEWNPALPWTGSKPKDEPGANPRLLTVCDPIVYRPHCLLAHPDGRTVVMGGTPAYGYTGGGLLFWDRKTETRVLLEHTDLLADHCAMSLVALPGGKLLVGSGTRAGTGGEVRAKEAELYVLDMVSKKIEWRAASIPGAQEYSEMRLGPDGLVYGIADFRVYEPSLMDEEKLFFVFDPARREIIHREDTAAEFGTMHLQQGQRKIVISPRGRVFLIFRKGIACADPATHKLSWLARSPVSADAGGDWLDGRIYFAGGSHLYSFQVE